jgi:hypothetical protein
MQNRKIEMSIPFDLAGFEARWGGVPDGWFLAVNRGVYEFMKHYWLDDKDFFGNLHIRWDLKVSGDRAVWTVI